MNGHEEVVQMLLDGGADVNVQSEWGTALCGASEYGHGSIVQILLDSGARVTIGRSRALAAAVQGGRSDIVQMLLNSMNAEDFDNEWQIASSGVDDGDDEIMKLLETHDFPFRHKPSVTEEA